MNKLPDNLPLVSIIVPVFNGEKYLRESLDSIVNQTYRNIEILVMDDASTDSTPEIIASYGERIKHIRQSRNKGIYSNANDGIEISQGKYIAIYHADDIYDPRIVEREVEYLENYPEVGAVFCKDIFVDGENQEYARLQLQPEVSGGRPLSYPVVFNALLEYKNWMFVCPTAMVRADVYRDVGTYRQNEFFNTSDLEMWLRIAQKYPLGIIEEYLLRYRHFEGQSSQRYHKLRTETGRYFTIMDLYLENDGKEIAAPKSLTAYEGHRAEDFLMITINNYILNQADKAKDALSKVRLNNLLNGHRIQRGRLSVLFCLLQILVRLPRIGLFANLFYQRWQVKDKNKKIFEWSRLFSNHKFLRRI
jgi:glycosyltransferase involved in cell wall biosynthesis